MPSTTWPTEHGPRALLRLIHDGEDPAWLAAAMADPVSEVRHTDGTAGRCWSVNKLRDVGVPMLLDLAAIADAGWDVRIVRERAGSGRIKAVIRPGLTA